VGKILRFKMAWEAVHKVYGTLFEIYQEQLKLGEEYELILALGYLTWLTPSGHIVRRHILAADAILTFEAALGKFQISPPPEGPNLRAEFDMLDFEEQPKTLKQIAQDELTSLDDDPWDRKSVVRLLTAYTNSLSDKGQGEYHDNLKTVYNRPTSKPIVEYAPALILRKRSIKGLEESLNKISSQIDSLNSAPKEFMKICETYTDNSSERLVSDSSPPILDQTIYFPKLSNEEQRDILKKMQASPGVLVQGPPGTGKSHTIANLLCHLLANGQRVLVTAKTPRALKVLHNLIPGKIRPLCISLLGSGIDEQRALEISVGNILRKQGEWKEHLAEEKITNLKSKYHRIKSEKAELEHQLKAIREQETHKHDILGGKYIGTTARVAKTINQESTIYDWLEDEIKYDQELTINPEDIRKLPHAINSYDPELELSFPDPKKDLMHPGEFKEFVDSEKKIKNEYENIQPLVNQKYFRSISQTNITTLQNIIDGMSKLITQVDNISNRPMPWIKNAIREILSDNETPWKDLHQLMKEELQGLKSRAKEINNISLVAPPDYNRMKIIGDAKILKQHFDNGGKIGWWIFQPKIVKEKKYLIEDIKINSNPCNNSGMLQVLIEYLSVWQSVENCWNLWSDKTERKGGQLVLQIAELEELAEALTKVVELYDHLLNARKALGDIPEIIEPAWHDQNSIKEFEKTCQSKIYENKLGSIAKKISEMEDKIQHINNTSKPHPINNKIIEITNDRNTTGYAEVVECLIEFNTKASLQRETKKTIQKLKETAPLLYKNLSQNPTEHTWNKRFEKIEDAWAWARAKAWLKEQLSEDYFPSLNKTLEQIEEELLQNLEELTEAQA